ncbi:MAG: bifunctional 5,10-methylenetetrahydrofolate dehydrogenase/5,10-methenyltetrahydrofolate cyclohydrolase [Candidatus Omnitrophota bacterium]|nr:MAG: bifunctional 5,10-methylenetetrahydrofolate dehydrogenase/5,10-methenyltetrahydrofolate cyclohydrolase [Candidatus Omnitrophota bacterium]
MAEIIAVDQFSQGLKERLQKERKSLGSLKLASLSVGNNFATQSYLSSQKKLAQELQIEYLCLTLGENATQEEVLSQIQKLNTDKEITGIILNKPFPESWQEHVVLAALSFKKDIEGMSPYNLGRLLQKDPLFVSPTALAVLECIDKSKVDLYGKEVTIVGFSTLIGKPLSILLADRFATVCITHIGTSQAGNLASHLKNADIVISAVGKPNLIKGDWIKEGAIVIDVGVGQMKGKLAGDVEFEVAKNRASLITPVPGGVGKLTTLFLFSNLLKAAQL